MRIGDLKNRIQGQLRGPSGRVAQVLRRVVSPDRAHTHKWPLTSSLSYSARLGRHHERVVDRTHQKDPRHGVRRPRFMAFCWSSSSLLLDRHGMEAEHSPRRAPRTNLSPLPGLSCCSFTVGRRPFPFLRKVRMVSTLCRDVDGHICSTWRSLSD